MPKRRDKAAYLLSWPSRFSRAGNICLRPYQAVAVRAVVDSIRRKRGLSFVWIFPRQSGKDEALTLLVQYLLALFDKVGGEMVFFNPTFKPQTETSMRRLESRLNANILTRGLWKKRSGYIFQLGNAFCTYMSADPTAHVVSATANRLLVVNEAQDIDLLKYDKDIHPMTASANATRVFAGTRWTGDTLLEREYKLAQEAEKQDGLRRTFFFTAEAVGALVPEYRRHVEAVIARLGRQHPLVKSQYFCELVEAEVGMFPPGRQALMKGAHSARQEPEPGKTYAFLIDVAGQEETRDSGDWSLRTPGRDKTFLKIAEVDLASLKTIGKPTYRVVFRREWTGASHVKVFGALKALKEAWRPMKIVIDATGVGEGLWSLLDQAYGENTVMPIKFTAPVKSALGYGFIGLIESGRYLEYHPFPESFRIQLDHCRSEILPGQARSMRWGVPDGTRGPNGEYVHDDDLITGALCSLLDQLQWRVRLDPPSVWIPSSIDPLKELEKEF